MAAENLTDAEVFQQFLTVQVATTGRTKSPEKLLRIWRERRQEKEETIEAIRARIADMEAGGCVRLPTSFKELAAGTVRAPKRTNEIRDTAESPC